MQSYAPVSFIAIEDPQQIKAFTDPLRVRVLVILAERAATNQQIADLLHEPQAKVLYHLRFLLDVGLIRLIDQRIKGGNVEKYYRATARSYGLRPAPELSGALTGMLSAELAVIGQELAESAARWPDQHQRYLAKSHRIAPERAEEFYTRLQALVAEYWNTDAPAGEQAPLFNVACVLYRNPRDETGASAAGEDDEEQ